MPLHSLYTESFGEGEKVLLCLHGLGSNRHYWSYAQKELNKTLQNYRLILVDLPGHGRSVFPKEETDYYDYTTRQLLALVEQPEISLLGHSMGGIFALRIASVIPSKVKQVILDSSPLFGWSSIPSSFFKAMGINPLVSYPLLSLMKCSYQTRMLILRRTVFDIEKLPAEDRETLREGLLGADRRVLYLANNAMRGLDVTKNIKEIERKISVTCLFGENDNIVSTSLVVEKLKKIESTSKIVIFPQTGHCAQMERPDAYYRTIKNCLNGAW
jgi:pimeloyl-ACP methyl ester carboxylesterase